jgi:hypothetical protein
MSDPNPLIQASAPETQETTKPFPHSLIQGIVSEIYQQEWHLTELRREFNRKDFVRLPALLRSNVYPLLFEEVIRLKELSRARDFTMSGYNTPRVLSVVGGQQILANSAILSMLYQHYDIRTTLKQIVGAELYPCLHPNEFMVINYLTGLRSTHGWHLDDPAYALILVFEAPGPQQGGSVELIQDWHEFCRQNGENPDSNVEVGVAKARSQGLIRTEHLVAGESYILRADKCLHRVTEVVGQGGVRSAMNLGFECTPNPAYGHTASALYGDE